MKKRIDFKIFIIFNKSFDIFLRIKEKDNIKRDYYINNFFNNNEIDNTFLDINNIFNSYKKDKYYVDVYFESNCYFYYHDKQNVKNEWLNNVLKEEMFNCDNYDIIEDQNYLIINKKVNLIINEIIKNINYCRFLEIKNVHFQNDVKINLIKKINSEYFNKNIQLVIINLINKKFILNFYSNIDKENNFSFLNEYNNVFDIVNDINLLINDKYNSFIYVDELFYEQIIDEIKLHLMIDQNYFINLIEEKK